MPASPLADETAWVRRIERLCRTSRSDPSVASEVHSVVAWVDGWVDGRPGQTTRPQRSARWNLVLNLPGFPWTDETLALLGGGVSPMAGGPPSSALAASLLGHPAAGLTTRSTLAFAASRTGPSTQKPMLSRQALEGDRNPAAQVALSVADHLVCPDGLLNAAWSCHDFVFRSVTDPEFGGGPDRLEAFRSLVVDWAQGPAELASVIADIVPGPPLSPPRCITALF